MKPIASRIPSLRNALLVLAATGASLASAGAPPPALVDDFDHPEQSSLGIPRAFADDTAAGGQTATAQSVSNGVLSNQGSLVPPRGQPGWASMIFLLAPDASPVDLSAYQGVRLKLRQQQGMLSLSVNSSQIDNFDYHAAIVPYQKGDAFHEVRIPFSDMKRAWSAQTPLDLATVESLSLVAVGMQKGDYAYQIDEIGFY